MPYDLLEKKIKAIPAEYMKEIEDFVDFIFQKLLNNSAKRNVRKFGVAKGKIRIPNDIDSCNDEIADMFGINGCEKIPTKR